MKETICGVIPEMVTLLGGDFVLIDQPLQQRLGPLIRLGIDLFRCLYVFGGIGNGACRRREPRGKPA